MGRSKGTTLYVNSTGSGGVYTSIQDAVNNAGLGDTVFVYSGIYYEPVVLNKTINLTGEDKENTVIDGQGEDNVIKITRDWVNITGFTIRGGGKNPMASAIELSYKENCRIFNNNIGENQWHGIYIYNDGNIISNNSFYGNIFGIYLREASGNIINGNTFTGNDGGIYSWKSFGNTITGNSFDSNEEFGIYLSRSSGENLSANIMVDDGILLEGESIEYWNSHNIETTNTVSGRPVHYWKNQKGGTVPLGAGQIILVGCEDVVVENQNLSNGSIGLGIAYSLRTNVRGNTISGNDNYGIFCSRSYYNNFSFNTAGDNYWAGIYLVDSNYNNASNNDVSHNRAGIELYNASVNIINDNWAHENINGMTIMYSMENKIVDNNISNNDDDAIYLHNGTDSEINNNYCSFNDWNIYAVNSENNSFYENYFRYGAAGFFLKSSNNNSFINNIIVENSNGFRLLRSNTSEIIGNTMFDNFRGIELDDYSCSNSIHHNNFEENRYQIMLNTSSCLNNDFDDGNGEGNYWDDYLGLDDGSNGRVAMDGIGDTMISHPMTDQGNGYFQLDNYPLTEPVPDTLAPRIKRNYPYNNSYIDLGTTLDFDVYDGNLKSVKYSINNLTEQLLDPPYDITTYDWDDGEYSIIIEAADSNGNTARQLYLFKIDTTPPEVQLNSPQNNSMIRMGTLLNFSIVDQDILRVNYSIDGKGTFQLYSPYDISTDGWGNGDHVIYIRTLDWVGNINVSRFEFTIDSVHPYVISSDPEDNSIDFNINKTISIAFNEPMNRTNTGHYISFTPFINFTAEWNDIGTILNITTESNGMLEGTTYSLRIDSQLTDVIGNPMHSSFILTFTTLDLDFDDDGIQDIQDEDDDNDGYLDEEDAFPLNSSEWLDSDNDNIGNNADPDDDNDGVLDEEDHFPLDPTRWEKEIQEDYSYYILFFIIMIVVTLILVIFVLRKLKGKSEPMEEEPPDVEHNELPPPPPPPQP